MISIIGGFALIVAAITLVIGLVFGLIVLLDKKDVINCSYWVHVVSSVAWSIFFFAAAVICFCWAFEVSENWKIVLLTLAGVGNLSNVGEVLKK